MAERVKAPTHKREVAGSSYFLNINSDFAIVCKSLVLLGKQHANDNRNSSVHCTYNLVLQQDSTS